MMTPYLSSLLSRFDLSRIYLPWETGCAPCDPIVIWLFRVALVIDVAITGAVLLFLVARIVRDLSNAYPVDPMKGVIL